MPLRREKELNKTPFLCTSDYFFTDAEKLKRVKKERWKIAFFFGLFVCFTLRNDPQQVSESVKVRGGKLREDALSCQIGVFYRRRHKPGLLMAFPFPDFLCTEAAFSFAVTSPARDGWRSGSQEQLGEHIHLGPNSSRTSSISLTPPPPSVPATALLPFNLYSSSHILHTLSWFCRSPCSVSFLPLWWNISPSLSFRHSFTAWLRKLQNSLVLEASASDVPVLPVSCLALWQM